MENTAQKSSDDSTARRLSLTALRIVTVVICLLLIGGFSQLKVTAQQRTDQDYQRILQYDQNSQNIALAQQEVNDSKTKIEKIEAELLDHDRTINKAIGLGMAVSALLLILQIAQIAVSLRKRK